MPCGDNRSVKEKNHLNLCNSYHITKKRNHILLLHGRQTKLLSEYFQNALPQMQTGKDVQRLESLQVCVVETYF